MAKRMFEFVNGTSRRFWEISLAGSAVHTRYGKIGAAGTATRKDLGTPDEAKKRHDKLVAEKTKKGYVEVGGAPSPKVRKPAASKSAASAKAAPTASALGNAAVAAMLAAIRKKHKPLAALLRPGASDAGLDVLRALAVPPAFLALYQAHDGSEAEFFGAYQLLAVAEIESNRQLMTDICVENPEWKASGRWHEPWIPFLSDGDGQYYVLDPLGSLEGGAPGNIVGYDHESGPAREFASFDVLVDLVTTLAKKGLLTQEAHEEQREKYEDIYATAQNVGLARMPPKELKQVEKILDDPMLSPQDKLDIALPLTRQYGADGELWKWVTYVAKALERWEIMAEAAAKTERLTPRRDRPYVAQELVLALHRLGRDKEALAALSAALKTDTLYPAFQIPEGLAPAFRHRCFVLATELRPHNFELWLEQGQSATDRQERQRALLRAVELCRDKDVTRFKEAQALKVQDAATRLLELDRIDGLAGKPKLDALLALAETYDGYAWGWLGEHHGDTWVRVAACATELEDWKTAEMAGARVIGLHHHIPLAEHLLAGYRVFALHKLGRDDEALNVLREVIEGIFDVESSQALEAIDSVPWTGAADANERAFERRCLELANEVQPENVFVWNRRALRADSPEQRRVALERVVELASAPQRVDYVPAPTLAHEFRLGNMAKHAAFRRMKEEAHELLGARGAPR